MRVFAFLFGVIFLTLGIFGFILQLDSKDLMFNTLKINFALNAIYVITGICAFIVGWINQTACRFFFQILGITYGIMAMMGFIYGDDEILDVLANNLANTWLHMLTAVAALILGYGSNS